MAEIKSEFLSVSPYLGPPQITDVKTFQEFVTRNIGPPGLVEYNYWNTYQTGDIVYAMAWGTGSLDIFYQSLIDDNTQLDPFYEPTAWTPIDVPITFYNSGSGFIPVEDSLYFPKIPEYVVGTDGSTLYPVLSSSFTGIYLAAGLSQSHVVKFNMYNDEGGSGLIDAKVVLLFDYRAGQIVQLEDEGIYVVGKNLYADGLLKLVNPTSSLLNDFNNSFLNVTGAEKGILINGIGDACNYPLPIMPTASADMAVQVLSASETNEYTRMFHTNIQSRLLFDDTDAMWRPIGALSWSSGHFGAPFNNSPAWEGFSPQNTGSGFFLDFNNLLGTNTFPTSPSYEYDSWVASVVFTPSSVSTNGQILVAQGISGSSLTGSGWIVYTSASKLVFDVMVEDGSKKISLETNALSNSTPSIVSFGRYQTGTSYTTEVSLSQSGTGSVWFPGSASYFIKLDANPMSSVYASSTSTFVSPGQQPWDAAIPWDANTEYNWLGKVVEYNGQYYSNLADVNLNNQPDISPTYWKSWPSNHDEFTWFTRGSTQFGPFYWQYSTVYFSGAVYYCKHPAGTGVTHPLQAIYEVWSPRTYVYGQYIDVYTTGSTVYFSGSATSSYPGWHMYMSLTGNNYNIPPDSNAAKWKMIDPSPANPENGIWAKINGPHGMYLGRYEDHTSPTFTNWRGIIHEFMFYSGDNFPGGELQLYQPQIEPDNDWLSLLHANALSASAITGRGGYISYKSVVRNNYQDIYGPMTYNSTDGHIDIDPAIGQFSQRPQSIIGTSGSELSVSDAPGTGTIVIDSGLTSGDVFWGTNGTRLLITTTPTRGDGGIIAHSPFIMFKHRPVITHIDYGSGLVRIDSAYSHPVPTGSWITVKGGWLEQVSGSEASFGVTYAPNQGSAGRGTSERMSCNNGFLQYIDDQTMKFKIATVNDFTAWTVGSSFAKGQFCHHVGTLYGLSSYYRNTYFQCRVPNTNVYPEESLTFGDHLVNYNWLYKGQHHDFWNDAVDRGKSIVAAGVGIAGFGINIDIPW